MQTTTKTRMVWIALGLLTGSHAIGQVRPQFPGRLLTAADNSEDLLHTVVGDFDGDGDIDIAGVVELGLLTVFENHGDMEFTTTFTNSFGQPVQRVASGDLDGDGDIDIAGALGESGQVGVLLCDGVGGFGPPTLYTVGMNLTDIAFGDLDNDGYQDLAVLDTNDGSINLLFGVGGGMFDPAAVQVPTVDSPVGIELGDLDGDGNLDILTVIGTGMGIRFNNGDRTFGAVSSQSSGTVPIQVKLGDADGDGDLDAFMLNDQSHEVYVFMNHGDGTFQSPSVFTVPYNPIELELYDHDRDNDLDVFLVGIYTNSTTILLNDGTGSYDGNTHRAPIIFGASSINAADIDGDGWTDMALSRRGSSANSLEICVNDRNGNFHAPMRWDDDYDIRNAAIGDFDADGIEDIVGWGDSRRKGFKVYFGEGDGSAGDIVDYQDEYNYSQMISYDLDGDLDMDLVGIAWTRFDNKWYYTHSFRLVVYLNDGSGTFIISTLDPLEIGQSDHGSDSASIWLHDFDGDGVSDDLMVKGQYLDGADGQIFQWSPSAGFVSNVSHPIGGLPSRESSIPIDVDLDGDNDLVYARYAGSSTIDIYVYEHLGNNEFAGLYLDQNLPGSSRSVVLGTGDLDNDNDMDLIIVNEDVYVHLNNGTGFDAGMLQIENVFDGDNVCLVADIDNDGNADVVLSDEMVLMGDGTGTLELTSLHDNIGDTKAIADYNNDGYLDILTASNKGPRVLLQYRTAALCSTDLTGDGELDIFDIFAYLDLFNAGDLTADITSDGSLDIFDVFAFLDAYSAGCP